ncbi:hypothetical protein QBC32DRAFT_336670 [Pseudoneurospora amorphoporcata]|uniref:Uncharacterized protein n=1 Tax=Pseudoneurospora amorphoporcata TaxID=241081 RepID=A0AAN6P2B0_9PEZI|nr:hypothetical protein QBC32DRAFT_336670 [Pseudoneurospora amorphoporcata]
MYVAVVSGPRTSVPLFFFFSPGFIGSHTVGGSRTWDVGCGSGGSFVVVRVNAGQKSDGGSCWFLGALPAVHVLDLLGLLGTWQALWLSFKRSIRLRWSQVPTSDCR